MRIELRLALAEDLDALIRLHDRELDAETLKALQAVDFPSGLALLPSGEAGDDACRRMHAAVAGLAATPPGLDQLAADYAAIYLNHAIGASPYESVWLDEEHLTCQQPMFELRRIYAVAGLQVEDWRRRHDDHLVLQLLYLRHALVRGKADWAALAEFLDMHVGYWLPDFARQVAAHGASAFYAALARLTSAWLERLRDLLAEMHGLARPPRPELAARIRRKLARGEPGEMPLQQFMPGAAGPGW